MPTQAHRPTPFDQWRDQQRATDAFSPQAALSPGREARRDLAIWAAVDAIQGEHPEARLRTEELVRLNTQLWAEQAAERGIIPETLDGCIGVLNAAARIMEAMA